MESGTEHLRCQDELTHVLGQIALPKQKALPQHIPISFLRAPEVDDHLQKSIFLLVFLNNGLQIQFNLLMAAQLRIVVRELSQKLQGEEEVLLLLFDDSSFD